jgi:hypothetical protein
LTYLYYFFSLDHHATTTHGIDRAQSPKPQAPSHHAPHKARRATSNEQEEPRGTKEHWPTMLIRNVLFLGACYPTTSFTPPPPTSIRTSLSNSYLDSINSNDGDRTSPSTKNNDNVFEEPSVDLNGRIVDRSSNLARQRDYQSVNEDPRPFDVESRSVLRVLHVVCLCIGYEFVLLPFIDTS